MRCIKCWQEFDSKYRHCQECYDRFKSSDPLDYQLLVNKDTPKEVRRKMDIWDTRNNSIMCNKCGDIIRSKNRHDFVWCKCKNCAVDWGSWYWRFIGDDWTNLSESFTFIDDK